MRTVGEKLFDEAVIERARQNGSVSTIELFTIREAIHSTALENGTDLNALADDE